MVQDNGPRNKPPAGLFEVPGLWRGPKIPARAANVAGLAARVTASPGSERQEALRILLLGDDPDTVEALRSLLERAGPNRYASQWLPEIPLNFRADPTPCDAVVVATDPDLSRGLASITALRAAAFPSPVLLAADGVDDEAVERAVAFGAADVLEAADLDPQTLDRAIRTALTRDARDRRLHQAARRDDLTGLANRVSFRDRLDHALTLARRGGGKLALLQIDLNGFKSINDRFGHPGGDELLRRIGERIRSRVRESDTVARLGGDEFGVLLPNIVRPEDAAVVVRKILEAIRPPIDLDGQPARVTASIGVAIFPDHAEDAPRLIRLADAAMYRAKRAEGSGCCWHDESRPLACPEAEELAAAFPSGAVTYVLRPQVGLDANRVTVGLRPVWRHPRNGTLDLLAMRALVEEAGLVDQLTERLLAGAVAKLTEWRRHGYDRVRISIPMLSRRSLAWAGLAERIAGDARQQEIPPERMEVEIDEQVLIEDAATGGQGAAAFARAGIPIAADQFGAGAMAVGLFTMLQPASVRFCAEALDPAGGDARLALFQGVAGLARRMGIHTVATGADDAQRMERARRIGVAAVETGLGYALATDLCLPWLQVATRRAG
ncbi:diguanylate cyclase domain-containing protein [Geminicoccus roseus]|uniref:diguanylate cyclase domain-containing protein n=1 Tax=Geminicoccus roseus TaxID=404900 RepID=UPI00040AB43C|nr:diguanylate cyclase [Geminicoccus roseus]